MLSVDCIFLKYLKLCTLGRAAGLMADRMIELTITNSEQGLAAAVHC